MDTMTYQWSDEESQFWFHLSETAPYAVGAGIHQMVQDLQDDGLPLEHIRHFVMHTGGETVIEAASASLGIDVAEVHPTVEALKNYGNNSSGSFMFAFEKMLGAPPCGAIVPGDLGAFMTMGPGAGFEFCLWSAGELSATDLLEKAAAMRELETGDVEVVQAPRPVTAWESPSGSSDDASMDPPTPAPSEVSTTETNLEAGAIHSIIRRVEDPPLSLGVVGSNAGVGAQFRRATMGKKDERTGPHLLFGPEQWPTEEACNPITKYLLKSANSSDSLAGLGSPLQKRSSYTEDVLDGITRRASMAKFLNT
jgi:hypothetical protein